jgi:acyl-coenzyme A synthetase/AMP-(fatty) acid ligase
MSTAMVQADGADVAFATSGSTGRPTTWIRTAEQLRAEATLIGDLLIGDVDEVICYAPPTHLFGRLFGDVMPGLRGVPVQWMDEDPVAVPRLRAGTRTLFVCLPSTWVVLRRLAPQISNLRRAVLLHGTGPSTPVTDEVLARLAGAPIRAWELFGSTETGAVAYRNLATARNWALWTLLPDVTLSVEPGDQADTHRLVVRSPRLARRGDTSEPPPSVQTEDVVRIADERRFEYLGRDSRLLKVNGRRCNLDHLERIARILVGRPVVCIPVRDNVRGEHYELFYERGEGPRVDREVWQRLAPLARAAPIPRSVHAVREIPLTATGKIKVDQLYASVAAAQGGGR